MIIDLHPDSIDDITRANLIQLRDGLRRELCLVDEGVRVFHDDPVKDKKEIKKYVKAFNLVIDYLRRE